MGKFEEELKTITDPSIQQIGQYLLSREDIRHNLEKENKSLKEMWQYIIGEMCKEYTTINGKLSGGTYKKDEDIYNLAVHYFDEDDIQVEQIKDAVVKSNKDITSKGSVKKLENNKISKPKKDKFISNDQISLFDILE